ncbi:MAG TPA: alpha-2-macroglobulin family protein, partial [Gemmatimonadota bacterium]|nr:alpha-2-macroglobulin family protein [Gemmatimonadota bacterium]
PDNLTRYRVIAVAAAGPRSFGKGESTITAALPLMARPSPPRFLNFGDQLELPVVVQNRATRPVTVDVAVRAANLTFTEAQGLRVEVPGEGRVEVRFPATTVQPGAVYVQVAAAAGSEADAAQVALPVWTPATTEAFATYGELDQGAASIPVMAPGDVIAEYGGLEVTTSSTALQALTDALLYLNAYPYECAEQLASRILAVAALRDVLTAFEAEGLPEPEAMVAAVDRDIKRLGSMQNYDGGFSFWGDPDEESWPYVSIHVAHALTRARQKDFVVPDELLVDVMGYLREIERHIPSLYPKDVRRTLQAYSLYVRMLMNDGDPAAARRIIGDGGLDSLPLEAAGWLLSVMSGQAAYADDVAAIRRYLGNRVSETAATAQFATGYGDGDYLVLYSSRRADAVILDALIADQPQSDLIPKLVRGLLGHRQRGHWLNTQENAFVLLALDRYFNRYESATPDFAARVWLGDDYAGGHEFRGRTTERHEIEVPMSMLVQRGGGENLVVGKDGPGRLYYRIGMRYAPADLQLDAAEHGFSVERTYQAVDDPDDVSREEDGTWVIRAGARVRVKLSLAAPARRYHVALVDPLPAGLEALNPELAGQQMAVDEDDEEPGPAGFGRRGWWPWWRWHEHQNLRDERVEVFTSLLWPGVYSYTYLARATTPGEFVVPPPKAEEMYFPETFGRGPSDRVVVRE